MDEQYFLAIKKASLTDWLFADGVNSRYQPDAQDQPGVSIVTTTTNESPPGCRREWERLQSEEVVKSFQGCFLWYSLAVFYPRPVDSTKGLSEIDYTLLAPSENRSQICSTGLSVSTGVVTQLPDVLLGRHPPNEGQWDKPGLRMISRLKSTFLNSYFVSSTGQLNRRIEKKMF
jgi:hypothetical protein